MKKQAKKSYINISELVHAYERQATLAKPPAQPKTMSRRDSNKENTCTNTRPSSQNSIYDLAKISNEHPEMLSKTVKIPKRTIHPHQHIDYAPLQPPPQTQNRMSIYESLSKKRVREEPLPEHPKAGPTMGPSEKMLQLQSLMSSEKMFIDPEKWEGFLGRAQGDQKFQRALSAFLYSYFIHNYQ